MLLGRCFRHLHQPATLKLLSLPTIAFPRHRTLRHLSLSGPTALERSAPQRLFSSSSDPAVGVPRGSLVRAYLDLCKARLSALVVITSGAGFLLAGHPVDWVAFSAAVSGTALAAAAANTFNQVIEAPLDALMKRTQGRPLPTGRLTRASALAFGGCATAASLGVLLAGTNPLTAALGMGNIALYALVYTPLKQVSTLNTAVGALVGAVPPLMGWAAATGSLAAVDPFLLAYVLLAWQFSHFYALAWPLRKDYARGGYHMVPVFDATGAHTARLIQRHALALSAIPLLSTFLGVTSPMFAVEGLVLNGYLLRLVGRFKASPSDASARAIFLASLWYLPLVAALFVFHANHWLAKEEQVQLDALVGPPPKVLTGGAEEGEERGTSWGEAAENALVSARLVGRALCLHELVGAQGAPGGEAAPTTSNAASGAGGGAASCPVVVCEAVAAASAAEAQQVVGGALAAANKQSVAPKNL
jgi:protoheme IX farnesyltransferase